MSDQIQDLQEAKDSGVLTFTTVRKERPIKIDGVDYTIRELSGPQRVAYRDELGKASKFAGGNFAGWTTLKPLDEGLVTRGLYKGTVAEGKLVTAADIVEWPASTIEAIANIIRKMSGLDAEAEDKAKND